MDLGVGIGQDKIYYCEDQKFWVFSKLYLKLLKIGKIIEKHREKFCKSFAVIFRAGYGKIRI